MFIGAVTLWYLCVYTPENNSRLFNEAALKTDIEMLWFEVKRGRNSWLKADDLLTFNACNDRDDTRALRKEALAWALVLSQRYPGRLCWVTYPHYYICTQRGNR